MSEEEVISKASLMEGSWTVVDDKAKKEDERVESVEDKKEEGEEDMSDGISVISESDTSHCGETVHLNECCKESLERLKSQSLRDLPDPKVENESLRKELRLLRQQSQQLIEQGKELVVHKNREESEDRELRAKGPRISWQLLIFATLSILALMGGFFTMLHHSLADSRTKEMIQKLDEVTAQNELLRNEVYSLNRIISSRQKEKKRDERKIKVWPGNGNTMDQIQIQKDDLKTPYTCGDNAEDIAGFCVATPPEQFQEEGGDIFTEDELLRIRAAATEPPSAHSYDGSTDYPEKQRREKKYKKDKNHEKKKYNSKESTERNKYKHNNSGERKGKHNNSGEKKYKKKQHSSEEWQQKQRNKQHKKHSDENNWYSDRANGREAARAKYER